VLSGGFRGLKKFAVFINERNGYQKRLFGLFLLAANGPAESFKNIQRPVHHNAQLDQITDQIRDVGMKQDPDNTHIFRCGNLPIPID